MGGEACWGSRICKNHEAACNSIHVPEKSDMSEQSRTSVGGAHPQCLSGSWSRSVTPNPRKAQIPCLKHLAGHSGPNPFSPLQSQSVPWFPCLGDQLPPLRGASQHLGFQHYHQDSPRQTGQQVPPAPSSPASQPCSLSFMTTHSTHPE